MQVDRERAQRCQAQCQGDGRRECGDQGAVREGEDDELGQYREDEDRGREDAREAGQGTEGARGTGD